MTAHAAATFLCSIRTGIAFVSLFHSKPLHSLPPLFFNSKEVLLPSMATEASLTDQIADKYVEEMKVNDDVKHVDEDSVSQPKVLEGKDEEEKLKMEELASVEASVNEQEEKSEDTKRDTLVEVVKKEAAAEGEVIEKEPESEAVEKPAEDSEVSLVQESEAESTKEPAVPETVIEEVKTKELSSALETEEKEIESGISTVAEPPSDVTGALNASKSAETSQDEKALAEVGESLESLKGEPSLDETSVQEIAASDNFDAIAVDSAEVCEPQNAGAVVPDAPDVPEKMDVMPSADGGVEESVKEESSLPEKKDVNPNADGGIEEQVKEENVSGETKVLEEPTELEKKAKEGEQLISSETTKPNAATVVCEVSSEGGAEKSEEKGESLEGDKTSLVEASTDLDADTVAEEFSTKGEYSGVAEVVKKDESLEDEKTSLLQDPDAATKAAEVSTMGEASGGVEVVDEKDASLEGAKTTLAETSRDLDVDSIPKEPVIDSKGAETELKPVEAIETVTDKLVNENSEDKKDENKKNDEAKDSGETKTEGEAPKQEAPTKPTQRQSNNIISKVKQSIVKVKKAIIGKSPSSKSMPAEGKDDIKAK